MVATVLGSPLLRICALWLGVLCGVWIRPVAAADIAPHVCLTRAYAEDTVATVLADPQRFDCRTPQTAFGPGNYWARLDGFSVAPARGDRLVLRLVSMWQDSATVHVHYADGKTAQLHYSAARASEHLTVGAIFELPLPWHQAPVNGILVHIRKSANVRGIMLEPKIMTERESAGIKSRFMFLYAAFAGIALTLLVYNLALWSGMRHRFQLYYCGTVASMMIYASSTSGALFAVFPGMNNIVRLQIGYIGLAMTAASALLFVRDFFEPHIVSDRLRKVTLYSASALVVAAIAFVILTKANVAGSATIYYAGFLPGIVAMLAIFVMAFRRRSQFLALFMLAWSPTLIAGALRWLHGIDLLPYSFWLDNSSLLAFMAEALISSTAISLRIRTLSADRDNARAEEAAARKLASHDPLTGLLNRRGFMEAAIGRGGDHSLILLDIDHFKQVNDSFGHEQGDAVLQNLAMTLRKWSAPDALVARLGGEEFAVLCPRQEGSGPDARALLALIRSCVQPIGRAVTSSAGLASGPIASEADWRTLYRDADAALYRAKADGRDRVSVATRFAKAA